MSNTRKPNPSCPDASNPEWTRRDMAKARPAAEVLPNCRREGDGGTFSAGQRPPRKESRKVNQTLRLGPDVIAAYRQEGRGWQTLINAVLREHMPGHDK